MKHESIGDDETTRSGLFYDQIRIIKEMREAYVQEPGWSDQLVRPARYSVWENVPGALSANNGEAFQAVLTEFVRIVEPETPPVPMPDKGKWPNAGELRDELGRWSLAWRIHDLQYWGCPQRRKRLCVLCDFDGDTAGWILFDPQYGGEAEDTETLEAESDTGTRPRSEVQPLGEGMSGHLEQSGAEGQGVAQGTEDGAGGPSYTLKVRGGIEVDSHGRKAGKGALVQTELSGTLGVSQDQTLIQLDEFCAAVNADAKHQQDLIQHDQGVARTLAPGTHAAGGGSNTSGPKIMSSGFKPRQSAAARDIGYEEEKSPTILTDANCSVLCLNDQGGEQMAVSYDQTSTLRAQMKHHEPIVYNGETVSAKYGTGGNNQPRVLESNQNHATITDSGVVNTLPSAMGMGGGYVPMIVDEPTAYSIDKAVTTGANCTAGGDCAHEEYTPPLTTDRPHAVAYGIDQQGGKGGANYAEDVCPAVLSDSHGTPHAVAYGIDHVVTTGGNCTAQGPCYYEETEATLKAAGPHAVAYGISAYDSNAMKSPNPHSGVYEADTSRTLDLNGGSPACNQGGVAIVEPVPIEGNGQRESHRGDGYGGSGDPMFTLNSTEHHAVAESYQDTTGSLMASGYDKLGTQEAMNDMYVVGKNWDGTDTAPTLTKNNAGGNQRMPDKDNFNAVLQDGVECMQNGWYQATGDMSPSLLARDYKDPPVVKKPRSVVRRLTPKECERLQGFPDDWTNLGEWTDSKGKKHKDADSPRYKALGNSIGLPFWQWLAERICAQYDRPVTMGSLFDGISGFPVCFARNGGIPVWSSEIEEFPIAVAKKHFGDDETGEVGDFYEIYQRTHKTEDV